MDPSAEPPAKAWLPLTPSGVAAFAHASFAKLWLVQLIMAVLTAAVLVWVLDADFFPVVTSAVDHLPQEGSISAGRLNWKGETAQQLSRNHFVAFSVDLEHTGQTRSPSQLQFEFGQADLRIYSIFGRAELPYPVRYVIPFNFQEVKPWWGAWAPILLAITTLLVIGGLFVSWTLMATAYCGIVWLTGLYLNRELTWRGSWLTAGAGLMPGALVMTIAMGCYGLAKLDLVRLVAAWVFHLLLGWVYFFLGAGAAPKLAAAAEAKRNPFTPAKTAQADSPREPAKSQTSNTLNKP
jgi:hypothetical protein